MLVFYLYGDSFQEINERIADFIALSAASEASYHAGRVMAVPTS